MDGQHLRRKQKEMHTNTHTCLHACNNRLTGTAGCGASPLVKVGFDDVATEDPEEVEEGRSLVTEL